MDEYSGMMRDFLIAFNKAEESDAKRLVWKGSNSSTRYEIEIVWDEGQGDSCAE